MLRVRGPRAKTWEAGTIGKKVKVQPLILFLLKYFYFLSHFFYLKFIFKHLSHLIVLLKTNINFFIIKIYNIFS